MRPDVEPRVDAAMAVAEAAAGAQAAGDLPRAARLHVQLDGMLAELVADDPDEPAHLQALAAQRYSAGEALLRLDPRAAVEVLGRAEEAYTALVARGGRTDEVPFWIADVRMRRARASLLLGRHASALADAQGATLAYLRHWDGTPDHPLALDTARILAWQAYVTSRCGDPDVAVAAADSALRVYLARAAEVNGSLELRAEHLPQFVLAARVAAVVHDAKGRDQLSAQASELGSLDIPTAVTLDELPDVPGVRMSPTLAEALDFAGGAADLREQLTAPAVDCRILVPADRCAPDMAPAQAERLAGLAAGLVDEAGTGVDADEGLAVALRLWLEAHALFANASEAGVPAMRYDAGRWSTSWADMAGRASQACHAAGGLDGLAVDLGRWMAGALQAITPFVVVDEQVRAVARRCTIWQGRLMAAVGDEAEARAALEALDFLDGLGAG
jgi:hypothetical protein